MPLSHPFRSPGRFRRPRILRPLTLTVFLALAACGSSSTANRSDTAALKQMPDASPAMLLKVADSTRAGGDPATAVGVYRQVHEMAPTDPVPLIRLGETLAQLQAYPEAVEAYQAALALTPKDPEIHRGLGMAFMADGKPQLAVAELQACIAARSDDARTYNALGVAYDMLGEHDAAQQTYRKGLSLAPDHLGLRNNLGLSQALAGDYRGAIATLADLVARPGATTHSRQTLALVYGLSGDNNRAASVARTDLDEAAVNNNLAYYTLLRALDDVGRTAAILGADVRAARIAQTNAPAPVQSAADQPQPAPLTPVTRQPLAPPAEPPAQSAVTPPPAPPMAVASPLPPVKAAENQTPVTAVAPASLPPVKAVESQAPVVAAMPAPLPVATPVAKPAAAKPAMKPREVASALPPAAPLAEPAAPPHKAKIVPPSEAEDFDLASPPVVTPHQEATALSNSNPATPDPAASETDSGGSGETSNAQVLPDKEGAVSVPADAKPAATPIAVAMPPSKGLIVVQLGSFHTATHAKMLTQTLGAKGHDLVVVHDHDRQGAEWFAVRTGEFPTQDAAESAAKELRDQGAWGAIVVHVARLKPMTADAKID